MNRASQLRRDLVIAFESLAGHSQREIAARHEVSVRTVRRAIRRAEQATGAQGHSEVTERLDQFWVWLTASIEDLGFARLRADNPRTVVAAIGKQADLMKVQTDILVRLVQFKEDLPK